MKPRTVTSPIWVHSPKGRALHHKREYTKRGGRTLCGIHVDASWTKAGKSALPKCKRCAA